MADTHCHKHNEPIIFPSHCLSCKSENEKPYTPKLQNAVKKFLERKDDLANRQRYLKDKVSTLEKSIPALMAFNMWMSGQKCENAPLCKIREIMNKFSPYPDPTEKLLGDLKQTIQDLNLEISELHDKIISADVDMEENGMKLESLELTNKEMEAELKTLEKEIGTESTLSLHSIHSEDLICLTRIRQLEEEKRSLKCCIKQLEEKEMMYRKQMECFLISKEFQKTSGNSQMVKRLKEFGMNDKKRRCTHQTQNCNMHQMKIFEKQQNMPRLDNQARMNQMPAQTEKVTVHEESQEQETGGDDNVPLGINKTNWTSWNKNQNNTFFGKSPNFLPRSCCVSLSKPQSSKAQSCCCPSISFSGCLEQNLEPLLCDKNAASYSPIKSPVGKTPTSGRNYSSNHQSTCRKCHFPSRFPCKGKCNRGKSENLCNCSTELESDYHPKAENKDIQNLVESNSDDEFCECD